MEIKATVTVKLDNNYVDLTAWGPSFDLFLLDLMNELLREINAIVNEDREIYVEDDEIYIPSVYFVECK